MGQRLFVGDVQGCADEFEELVARARAELGGDFELLLVGDLVNRGPASFRTLNRVRELAEAGRARSVLGNHDLRLVSVALGAMPLAPEDTFRDVLERADADDWIDWLRRRPLLIDGPLGGSRFALVHASLAPSWSLPEASALAAELSACVADPNRSAARAFLVEAHAARQQRPMRPSGQTPRSHSRLDALGRMISARSALPGGGWSEAEPREVPGAEPWHAAWSRAGHAFGVVYGHWAMQRLHVAPRLRGLDTGCVHHGRGGDGFLSAWLPDEAAADPFAIPDAGFWRVPARRRYGA